MDYDKDALGYRIAELEAELDRAANEIHRLGMKSSQQEDTIAGLENELSARNSEYEIGLDELRQANATIAELREWFLSEYGGQLPLRIMEILRLDQDTLLGKNDE